MTDRQLVTRATPLTLPDRAALHVVPAALALIGGYMFVSDRSSRAFGSGQPTPSPALFRRVAGLRTAWLGVAVLTLCRADQHRPLGWLLLAMAANPASDMALVAMAGGGRRSLVHLPGTLATAVLGAHLLRLTGHPTSGG